MPKKSLGKKSVSATKTGATRKSKKGSQKRKRGLETTKVKKELGTDITEDMIIRAFGFAPTDARWLYNWLDIDIKDLVKVPSDIRSALAKTYMETLASELQKKGIKSNLIEFKWGTGIEPALKLESGDPKGIAKEIAYYSDSNTFNIVNTEKGICFI